MLRPLELAIGLRYTRARRRNHFISFISLISILGIALGVAALITVLSVMNGFERELRDRILGMVSHATISGYDGTLANWEGLARAAAKHRSVIGVAPYIRAEGMFTSRGQVAGAVIRGVLPDREPAVSEINRHMRSGRFDALAPGAFNVILGSVLAARLGVKVGDKVTLVAPEVNVTPVGILPRLRRFTVVGTFEVGHAQYDGAFALIHLADAARLFRLGDKISGLRLKLDDLFAARRVSVELARDLGGRFWITDWTQYHANFFRALRIEKTVMFIILSLIVAVAAFNIVSTLIMVVTDKASDIAILRTLGAAPASVMLVFIVQGIVIGLLGTGLGVLGGIALAANVETVLPAVEQILGTKFLDPGIYFITEVPSDMRWRDIASISGIGFAMCVLATVYPAWRASRTEPAAALRYE